MSNFFFVKVTNPVAYSRVEIEEIHYVRSVNGKVELVLSQETLVLNKKLVEIESRLNQFGIIRVSRDTLVPIKKIKHISNNELFLVDEELPSIKISRQYRKELIDQCRVYMLAP